MSDDSKTCDICGICKKIICTTHSKCYKIWIAERNVSNQETESGIDAHGMEYIQPKSTLTVTPPPSSECKECNGKQKCFSAPYSGDCKINPTWPLEGKYWDKLLKDNSVESIRIISCPVCMPAPTPKEGPDGWIEKIEDVVTRHGVGHDSDCTFCEENEKCTCDWEDYEYEIIDLVGDLLSEVGNISSCSTGNGYCCACEYDIAGFKQRLNMKCVECNRKRCKDFTCSIMMKKLGEPLPGHDFCHGHLTKE